MCVRTPVCQIRLVAAQLAKHLTVTGANQMPICLQSLLQRQHKTAENSLYQQQIHLHYRIGLVHIEKEVIHDLYCICEKQGLWFLCVW